MIYDVVIVGAGPAGLFAAYRLKELDRNLRIIIIDKGKNYQERECPALKGIGKCEGCMNCELISGEGGAGLFSDGKLVYTLNTGTNIQYSNKEKIQILEEIKEIFTKFNGNFDYTEVSDSIQKEFQNKFNKVGLNIKFHPVFHIGSFHLKKIMSKFLDYIRRSNISISLNTEVIRVEDWEQNIKKVFVNSNNGLNRKKIINGKRIIFAMGKEGSFKLSEWVKEAGIQVKGNRCYFGLRIELPTKILKRLFEISPNPKIYRNFQDGTEIKTHCFCNNGEILLLKYHNWPLVGGHAVFNGNNSNLKSKKSNFAILLGKEMKYPDIVDRSLQMIKKTHEITNGYLLAQRMGDFISEKIKPTSTQKRNNNNIRNIAKLGNIAKIDIPFNFNLKCIDFLKKMNHIIPGVLQENSLLYAPAIEWWMPKIETNKEMQTKCEGIYVIGDGAGISQGIVQSIATALIAAQSIYKRERMSSNNLHEKIRPKFLHQGCA